MQSSKGSRHRCWPSEALCAVVIGLSQQYLQTGLSDPGYLEAATSALSQQFWAARLDALAYLMATPILSFRTSRKWCRASILSGDSWRSCCWRQVWQSASVIRQAGFSWADSWSFRSCKRPDSDASLHLNGVRIASLRPTSASQQGVLFCL